MDQAHLNPNDDDTIHEVQATQVAGHDTGTIKPPESQAEIDRQLHSHSLGEWWQIFHRFSLRLISLALVGHGILNIYGETVEVLYVFPHLPEVVEDTNYNQEAINSLYQKAIIVLAAASIETIYGMALLARHKHSIHSLHILSGFGILIISLFINSQTKSIEDFDFQDRIPTAPTPGNLIKARSIDEVGRLFTNF